MTKIFTAALFGILTACTFLLHQTGEHARNAARPEKRSLPGDWFYRQRAYPRGTIDPELRKLSLIQAERLRREARSQLMPSWQFSGPTNIGGRITTMAISRQNPAVLYIGGADGGVFKTTNGGANWMPLFDDQRSLSMGAIAVDPSNDNIVYVGTGEANSSGDSYDGFGVVKSTNGGSSWFSCGLEETRHIGKVIINPLSTQTVYVAAMGNLYTGNSARGVYKSTNGGESWTRVLFINDSTGAVDLAIDPQNPNILLAAAWQRMRGPEGRRYVGGPGTGIYRTMDGGSTWILLSGGLPSPGATVGRPAVAIAPSNPLVVYAAYADDPGNFLGAYRSTDRGDTWARTNDGTLSNLYSNFGWYFGKVFVAPQNENALFVFGVTMGKSSNGGATWTTQNSSHVDHHAMAFHPTDPAVFFVGNDGGFAKSTNGGTTWFRYTDQDLPISQFYAGSIDHLNPSSSIGGTQDNGTIRTLAGASNDWTLVNGGDGFYAAVDYTNSNYQYAESQYGAIVRTTNNWASSQGGSSGFTGRKNWSTPIIMDPNNPLVLYTGSERLHRSTNRAASWVPISPDLTNGPVPGFSAYATITTIDVAKTDSNAIIVGTDDANVWVTTNLGGSWTNVRSGLPNRWVTRVRFDPTNHRIAYVTLSGYRHDTPLPHIFRTTTLGAVWEDITGNLPESPINVVVVDPLFPSRLYVGTDVGAFFTTNSGGTWNVLGIGLPNSVIADMALHRPTRRLRAFTHGRSMWQINVDSVLASSVAQGEGRPVEYELLQNYPNPFNPSTVIGFRMSDPEVVMLRIVDGAGRTVRTLIKGEVGPGQHTVTWDGTNDGGAPVASGVYFSMLSLGGSSQRVAGVRKMLLLR